jgi:hypothetical protein
MKFSKRFSWKSEKHRSYRSQVPSRRRYRGVEVVAFSSSRWGVHFLMDIEILFYLIYYCCWERWEGYVKQMKSIYRAFKINSIENIWDI